jgi:hypothetical protein
MNEERRPVGQEWVDPVFGPVRRIPKPTPWERPLRAVDAVADDTPVWRYLSLRGVIDAIERQRLRLTRVDKFRDAFEGSVTKRQMDDQDILLAGAESRRHMLNIVAAHHGDMAPIPPPDENPWARITRWRRARTRSAHASCWALGDETEALWRLYCTDDGCQGLGLALRTTLARLKRSVEVHNLDVRPITYIKYQEAPAFTNDMAPLFHKRHGFAADHELRLLKFNEEHFKALIPKDASVRELDEHIYLDWVLRDVIDEIIISPYADDEYEQRVRDDIKTADPSLGCRVALSELHERRYPGLF